MIDKILLGQGLVLQFREANSFAHEAPPAFGALVTLRLLVCRSPPHVTGQLLHLDHPPTSQSTIRKADVFKVGNRAIRRTTYLQYVLGKIYIGSPGHGVVLHSSRCNSEPLHFFPPCCACCLTCLVDEREPFPHDVEHEL